MLCNTHYVFVFVLAKLYNMGNGNHIFDHTEASKLLLRRAYEHIADGIQVKPKFIPETFLPDKYTRGVDPDNFEDQLELYHESDSSKEQGEKMKEEDELSAHRGVSAEREVYDELKRFLIEKKSKSIVLHGTQLILPKILCRPETEAG